MKNIASYSNFIIGFMTVLLLNALTFCGAPQAHAETPLNDQQVRKLLLSTDSIKAFIQTLNVYGEEGPTVQVLEDFISDISPEQISPLIEIVNIKKSYPYNAAGQGSIIYPTLFLVFYKNGEQIGFFETTYQYSSTFFYAGNPGNFKYNYVVSAQSAYTLREYVARNPVLAKALWKAGVRPQDLAPRRALQPIPETRKKH